MYAALAQGWSSQGRLRAAGERANGRGKRTATAERLSIAPGTARPLSNATNGACGEQRGSPQALTHYAPAPFLLSAQQRTVNCE